MKRMAGWLKGLAGLVALAALTVLLAVLFGQATSPTQAPSKGGQSLSPIEAPVESVPGRG